jgi:hypothetical protein
MRALDDMENANAQVEVAVEEVTKARTQKIKVMHLLAVTMLSSFFTLRSIGIIMHSIFLHRSEALKNSSLCLSSVSMFLCRLHVYKNICITSCVLIQ